MPRSEVCIAVILEHVIDNEKGSGTPDTIQHVSALVFIFIRNILIWVGVKTTKAFFIILFFPLGLNLGVNLKIML